MRVLDEQYHFKIGIRKQFYDSDVVTSKTYHLELTVYDQKTIDMDGAVEQLQELFCHEHQQIVYIIAV